ncbi:MAG TPA: transaldolase family protein [Pirellulaceae bacterium]|nr:transaldolase family protein [Pirellulaceae bacterium]HMO90612.1 transaldolase family protein [Pirellulaceae bacterium]HMP67809.1 transaldolase family protein [Pirellulaceae bacterium]
MSDAIRSLIGCGTKLWLDSIDPKLIDENRLLGATGATSNPIIISDLIKSGRFDERLLELLDENPDDEAVAWAMTDELVSTAEEKFLAVYQQSQGDDGYVSFELDPLIEDESFDGTDADRISKYIESGIAWNKQHVNRMIKVPATTAGLGSLESLVKNGVSVNVTLIFTLEQYRAAREAVWRGAQARSNLKKFKSVYSIFVSRIDVYTKKHCRALSAAAQGLVGIVNAQRIWAENQEFWRDKACPLRQEIVFASTGSKDPADDPCKYVKALAGSDIQTNPPQTNEAIVESGHAFTRLVDRLPPQEILDDIDQHVDFGHLFNTLMAEGIAKFSEPQKDLLRLISKKRHELAGT